MSSAPIYTEDRIGILWRFKFLILGITLALAVVTFVVSKVIPATYSSDGSVSFSVAGTVRSSAADSVTASNDFASQYSAIIRTSSVANAAAKSIDVGGDQIRGKVSASILLNQNLVKVSVVADSASKAERYTDAVLKTVVQRVTDAQSAAQKDYKANLTSSTVLVDASIATARNDLSAAENAAAGGSNQAANGRQNGAQTLLSNLILSRQTVLSNAALNAPQPRSAQITAQASDATVVTPNAKLYTLIAFILGLIVVAEILVVTTRRRQSLQAAPVEESS
jgi:capsular polysaccharide biosynthesis protein